MIDSDEECKTPKMGDPTASDESLPGESGAAGARNRRLPPVQDLDMRIARDGIWFYRGSPINRKPLVKLFATVLRREGDGEFWLVTPVERGRVAVEDAPFVAVELRVEGEGRNQVLSFRTNLDDWVAAGSEHPLRVAHDPDSGAPRPYILIRDGLEALLVRAVYYQLADLAVPENLHEAERVGVWSQRTFFPIDREPRG